MKLSKLGLITALLAGSVALSTAYARAGDTNQPPTLKAAAKPTKTAAARVKSVTTKLKLTPDQSAKLLPIFQEEIDKRADITKRRHAERDKVFQDFLAEIKTSAGLSDAQYTQLVALENTAPAAKPKKAPAKTVKQSGN